MFYILGAGGQKLDEANKIRAWAYLKSGIWGNAWRVWPVDAKRVILALDNLHCHGKRPKVGCYPRLYFIKGVFTPTLS